MKRDEIICGVIIFLFGGFTTLLSLRMPIGTFRMAGSGFFPLCLGILLMVLSILFILKLLHAKKKTSEKQMVAGEKPKSTRQIVLFLSATVFATLCFTSLGYPFTAFLLMVLLLRSLGIKRWVFVITLSLITACASYFLFVQWLKIPLPKGWIGL